MRNSFVFLLIVVCLKLEAQTSFRFADTTARWNIVTYENGMWCNCVSYYTTIRSVEKDTAIGGLNYQQITGNISVRQDSTGAVYQRLPSDLSERKIYDFGKVAGDTFRIENTFGSLRCTVVSVDSVYLITYNRKRVFIRYEADFGIFGILDTWIEGVGSLKTNPFNPGENYMFLDGENTLLLCFHEGQSGVYYNDLHGECLKDTLYYLGLAESITKDAGVVVDFLEQTNVLSVDINESNIGSVITIFDLLGRPMSQLFLNQEHTIVDLSKLSNGIYFYQVSKNNKGLATGKLLLK